MAVEGSSGPPRLIVYGTLRPGGENHHVVAHLKGRWCRGHVRGDHSPVGWGTTHGYPALVWREDGPPVDAHLLESEELAGFWTQLDAFEGPAYVRAVIPFHHEDGRTSMGQAYLARATEDTAG